MIVQTKLYRVWGNRMRKCLHWCKISTRSWLHHSISDPWDIQLSVIVPPLANLLRSGHKSTASLQHGCWEEAEPIQMLAWCNSMLQDVCIELLHSYTISAHWKASLPSLVPTPRLNIAQIQPNPKQRFLQWCAVHITHCSYEATTDKIWMNNCYQQSHSSAFMILLWATSSMSST